MPTDLGFLTDMEPQWNLWDSTKIGGFPVWLNPEFIPEPLLCSYCNSPMMFLLQSYLPYEEREDSYHRVLYVFICPNQECIHKGSCVALRCQLPHQNKYYNSDLESKYKDPQSPSSPLYWGHSLCHYCHQKGLFPCKYCQKVYYCSPKHQACDWVQNHRFECQKPIERLQKNSTISYILPEYEVYLEEEEHYIDKENELELEKEYRKLLSTGPDPNALTDHDIGELMKQSSIKDPYVYRFNRYIQYAPQQILRVYSSEHSILWVSYKNQIEDSIPCCPLCHAPRHCELQIMPQLIYYLEQSGSNIPSLDFGTILIYTCSNCCKLDSESKDCYVREYTFIQQFDATDEVDESEEEIIEESLE